MNQSKLSKIDQSRRSQNREEQNISCESSFGTKRNYNQDLMADDRNEKYRLHFDDKQNLASNSRSSLDRNQQQDKDFQKNYVRETQKQKRGKKYAYIKNSNSLIHSDKYREDQLNDLNDSKKDYDFDIERNRQMSYDLKVNSGTLDKESFRFSQTDAQPNSVFTEDQQQQIYYLRQSLQEEKQKFTLFQQQTIRAQMKILQTINILELKLKQLRSQNFQLRQQNQFLKQQLETHSFDDLPKFNRPKHSFPNQSFHPQSIQMQSLNSQIRKLNQLLKEKQRELGNLETSYKKVKGVSKGLVDMMKKVDSIETPQGQDEVRYAWKWVKKVVWEYQAIRKKAYEWKKVYDEFNKDSQNQESVSLEDAY